jgi:ribonuclease HII
MPCSFERECALREQGFSFVAGIDEAGRGPLAGPVVAAAVVFLEHEAPEGLDDSKKLPPSRREALYETLSNSPHVLWAVSVQSAEVVDRLNILRATHQAMREAVASLKRQIDHALIDGLPVRDFPTPHTALVGGDALSFSIAAASVIAKVTRDRIMHEAHERFPQYGFLHHKGYGTPEHLAALREHGPCPLHRISFAPVAQLELF